jgi:hypothetical protein
MTGVYKDAFTAFHASLWSARYTLNDKKNHGDNERMKRNITRAELATS